MKLVKMLALTLCVSLALVLAAGIQAKADCSKAGCDVKKAEGKCPAKDANDCPKGKDPNTCPDKKAVSAADQPTALGCCEGNKKEGGCSKDKADPNAPAKCPDKPAQK